VIAQPDIGFTALVSPRLVIDRFTLDDLDTFVTYRNDPEVARHQGWRTPYPRDVGERFFSELGGRHPDVAVEWYQFAIREHPGDPLVGDVGVRPRPTDPGTCDLGVTLGRGAWGRGYASEALGRVVRWLFEERAKVVCCAEVDERNTRSRAMLARLGFLAVDGDRRAVWVNGGWTFEVRTALLADRWLDLQREAPPDGGRDVRSDLRGCPEP
jgi:aminoglycoside 6'-N-acetyltransferase